jgi:hypothetical protein
MHTLTKEEIKIRISQLFPCLGEIDLFNTTHLLAITVELGIITHELPDFSNAENRRILFSDFLDNHEFIMTHEDAGIAFRKSERELLKPATDFVLASINKRILFLYASNRGYQIECPSC